MLRLYPASKYWHAHVWRSALERDRTLFCCARWVYHSLAETPDIARECRESWQQNVQDIKDADVVVVWGKSEDQLRGALVEAGIALAFGIPVILAGTHDDHGSWQYHPLVIPMPDFDAALRHARTIMPRYRTGVAF